MTGYGAWQPLELGEVAELFATAPFRWWVSGGHALDLHLGRSWRAHGDMDVGVVRDELDAVYARLCGWQPHIAAGGRLSPWRGERLDAAREQNNVWCRRQPGGPWVLDVTIGDGSAEEWIYRRDPSLRLPWDQAVLRASDGTPYLAPEVQLLFKSKGLRPKDDIDAAEVIPELDVERRERLARWLAPDHPWQQHLR